MTAAATFFRNMEAAVTLRRYPGLGHTIHEEEVDLTRNLIQSVAGPMK